ncbi:MAG: hypothetical protein ABH864_04555 [archaeon]
MVNQDIVKYLEEGKKRGFSIQLLKGKLLEGGFNEGDIDNAIATMSVPEKPSGKIDLFDKSQDSKYQFKQPTDQKMPLGQAQQQRQLPGQQMSPTQTQTSMNEPGQAKPVNVQPSLGAGIQQKQEVKLEEKRDLVKSGSEGKWMKIGGILGIVLLILGIAGIILNFAGPALLENLMGNNLTMLIIGIVLVLMSSIYYYAFVRVGKKSGQKMLSMGSWFTIISLIIYLLLVMGASVFVYEQAMNFYSGVDSEGSYKITFLVLSILWVVTLLVHVVGMILGAVGMIRAGREIKVLRIAGIVNVLVFIAGLGFLVGIVMFVYATLNDFSVGSAGLGQEEVMGNAVIAIWSLTALFGLKQIARIFEFIGLFSASKKFE